MTKTELLTVDEFLRIPDPPEGHYELHHGELVLVPPPKFGHEEIQDQVQTILKKLLRGRVRMEMTFRPLPEHEVWRADVGYMSAERAQRTGGSEYLQGAPDLVVEVLSPSNTVDAINERIAICVENGCRSFWVIDPKRHTVSVTEADTTKHYPSGSALRCCLFSEPIPVDDIFASPEV